MIKNREIRGGLRRAKNEIEYIELRAKREGLEALRQRMLKIRESIEQAIEVYGGFVI